MIISNISSKVIFVGDHMLLPDDQVELPDNLLTPSLEAIEKVKAIKIFKGKIKEPIPVPRVPKVTMAVEEPKAVAKAEPAETADAPVETAAETAPKKGGRTKKTAE